jgi:hypothetical protein
MKNKMILVSCFVAGLGLSGIADAAPAATANAAAHGVTPQAKQSLQSSTSAAAAKNRNLSTGRVVGGARDEGAGGRNKLSGGGGGTRPTGEAITINGTNGGSLK